MEAAAASSCGEKQSASVTAMIPAMFFPPLLMLTTARTATSLTYTETDPVTGNRLECDRCPPGTYLLRRCTATTESVCAQCPEGSFTELWNYIGKCLRCGSCDGDQVEKTACTAERDRSCECKPGFYLRRRYDMCWPHTECPSGQGVLTSGTAEDNTLCFTCPNGTYSDVISAHHNCTKHTNCGGERLVLRGSSWHDSVCTDSEELASRDGADYLRKILPAFFTHHKVTKRLRRIVHHLPMDDRKRLGGTSAQGLSEQLNAWISSAAPQHIRQLPHVLDRAGANSASIRLQSKLHRIDSNLRILRNEVDGGSQSG